MIVLRTTTDPQTFNFLANVAREDLPLNATFRFRDTSSNTTQTVASAITANGFRQTTSLVVDLVEDSKYELTILNGTTTIHKDVVFVTNQTLADYSTNDGDFVYFDEPSVQQTFVIF